VILAIGLGAVAGFAGVIVAAAPLGLLLYKLRQNVLLANSISEAVAEEMRKAIDVERNRGAT
jgi:hypothetical protein